MNVINCKAAFTMQRQQDKLRERLAEGVNGVACEWKIHNVLDKRD